MRLINHEFDSHLPDRVGAQFNRFEFIEKLLGFVGQIMSLHVSTTEPALAEHTLRDGVHGDELELAGVWLAHLVKDLPHGYKLLVLGIDILLVDLVGQDHNTFTMADTDDGLQVLTAHDLASRVAWIDDDDGAGYKTFFDRRVDLLLESLGVECPATRFIKIVGKELAAEKCQ